MEGLLAQPDYGVSLCDGLLALGRPCTVPDMTARLSGAVPECSSTINYMVGLRQWIKREKPGFSMQACRGRHKETHVIGSGAKCFVKKIRSGAHGEVQLDLR